MKIIGTMILLAVIGGTAYLVYRQEHLPSPSATTWPDGRNAILARYQDRLEILQAKRNAVQSEEKSYRTRAEIADLEGKPVEAEQLRGEWRIKAVRKDGWPTEAEMAELQELEQRVAKIKADELANKQ